MIEVRLDVISDYVYVHVVYTQTWTYDEALKAPKIRTSLDEPIIDKIISTAKTGRGTCTECGAKIEKGEHRVGVPYVWEPELQANGKPKRKGPATGAILKYMHLACAQLKRLRIHATNASMKFLRPRRGANGHKQKEETPIF